MVDGSSRSGRHVRVRYRSTAGTEVDTTLDRVALDDLAEGLPVREFRWYKGRRHYSGWYWSSTVNRLVIYECRLELARIMLADLDAAVVGIAAQPFQLVVEGALIPRVLGATAEGRTIVDVERSLLPAHPAVVRPVVLHLLWRGELHADLAVPLDGTSVVRPRAEAVGG